MRRQYATPRAEGRNGRLGLFLPFCGTLAVGCLVSGLYVLWLHAHSSQAQDYRAVGGVMLALLGLVQIKILADAWRQRAAELEFSLPQRMFFWKGLFAGACVCYVAGLALGPDPSVGYLFCTAAALWHTVVLWLLVKRPGELAKISDRGRRKFFQRLNRAAFGGLALIVGAEASLRLYAFVADDRLPVTYIAKVHALPPGEQIRGRLVNTLGYWDKEFKSQLRPGVFRIAVLGDGVTLSGTAETNCLARIERSVPGIEIYNFGIPDAGPREYAAQLAHEVASFQPDLVLTFFSIGDDVTHRLPLPGMFDWHGLRLYQIGARSGVAGQGFDRRTPPLCDQQQYLRSAVPRLAVCRTPIDDYMSNRWQETVGYLDDIVQFCRRREIPTALVLVPGEFQVNAALCESLRRQAGVEAAHLDIDLPQRRLTVFAEDRQVPVLDLLPSLRASDAPPYLRNAADWNERGHAIAADLLGRWIERRYGTQLASTREADLAANAGR